MYVGRRVSTVQWVDDGVDMVEEEHGVDLCLFGDVYTYLHATYLSTSKHACPVRMSYLVPHAMR